MKFLYYLACIGEPDLKFKLSILKHNLHYIYNNINVDFDIIVNMYEIENNFIDMMNDTINECKFIKNKYIYSKKGILTELFLTNIYNNQIDNYDYIMFILDDVKIENLNLNEMIKVKENYNIQFLSPKILNSTHPFMRIDNKQLSINNFLEIYCLLLTPKDIQLFFSLYDIHNKWMWGVDFMFGYLNIKTGVIYSCICNHALPSKSNQSEALQCMKEYFKDKSFDFIKLRKMYNPVVEFIEYENRVKILYRFIIYSLSKFLNNMYFIYQMFC